MRGCKTFALNVVSLSIEEEDAMSRDKAIISRMTLLHSLVLG